MCDCLIWIDGSLWIESREVGFTAFVLVDSRSEHDLFVEFELIANAVSSRHETYGVHLYCSFNSQEVTNMESGVHIRFPAQPMTFSHVFRGYVCSAFPKETSEFASTTAILSNFPETDDQTKSK